VSDDSAQRVARHRARKARTEQLAAYDFAEGQRPSDKVRQALRAAVQIGELKVPKEGFDDGSPWRYYPGEIGRAHV